MKKLLFLILFLLCDTMIHAQSTSTETITFGDGGKQTVVSLYDLDFSSLTDVKAYIVTGYDYDSGDIFLTGVTDVPAGTPILVTGPKGETKEIPVGKSMTYYPDNMLVGSAIEETYVGVNDEYGWENMVLNEKSGDFRLSKYVKITAGKAYLRLPPATNKMMWEKMPTENYPNDVKKAQWEQIVSDAGLAQFIGFGTKEAYAYDKDGRLYVTKDGGVTWIVEELDESATLLPKECLAFVSCPFAANKDADCQILAGIVEEGDIACRVWRKIADYTDGSQSAKWKCVPINDDDCYYLPAMCDFSLVWFQGHVLAIDSYRILGSLDGGITWRFSELLLPTDDLYSVEACTDDNGDLWLKDKKTGNVWRAVVSNVGQTQHITLSSTGKLSYVTPCDLDFTNVEGLKAYTVTGYAKDGTILFSPVKKVSANTPLYLVRSEGGSYTVPSVMTQVFYVNMLKGDANSTTAVKAVDGDYTNYVLSNNTGTFVQLSKDVDAFPAGTAYLPLPTAFISTTDVGTIIEVDGIYYIIGENNTVSVTSGEVKYSGDVVIPKQVKYNGETYTVTSIGMSAFRGSSDLISVTIPNTVTHIGEEAFWCDNDISIHITDLEAWCKISFNFQAFSSYDVPGWTNYYHRLFLNGIEITDLVIPSGVKSIGFITFSNCTSITSVTIPNSVTSIGDRAFEGCSGLTTITLEIEKPFEIVSGTFSDDTYNVAELIVPYGTKAAYQATEGWNQFAKITESSDKDEVAFAIDGISYQGSKSEKNVVVKSVDTKQTSIEVPASVSYGGTTYQVTGIADDAFKGSNMGALIWNVEAVLPNNAFSNASIGSNFLLYVKSATYAPSTVKNVVVNGTAQTIVLSDDGGQFYCPQAFSARRISYSHNYSMETGKGSTMGWESIALPFDVQRIIHSTQGEIVPFAAYSSGSNQKPFWLAYMSASGFKRTADIRANEAYIIAMPNNSSYQDDYILAGDVTFSAENITVPQTPTFNGTFLPAFSFVAKSSSVYALNVNNRYVRYSGSEKPGSVFIRDLRDVRPFEAYLTGNFTRGIVEINYDNGTTDILDVLLSTDDFQEMTIHTLSGLQVTCTTQRDFDSVWQQLPKGVYIVNGKKLIK